MKLSIIVPVYNMEAGGKLAFCMDSLLAQKLTDYEIIAVDDASTDQSLRILEAYQSNHPEIIKVIASSKNGRQGTAKNIGLRHAVGTWIGFMDSDDWADPEMFSKLLEKAEAQGADMAGCDYQIVYEQSFQPGKLVINNTQEQTGILDHDKYASLILKPGSMVVKIYRHQVIQENGLLFPEGVFYEDNCAGPVWNLHFKHFVKVDEPLYYYYQHEVSTVHHISEIKCQDRLTTGQLLVDEFKRYGFYEEYKKELEYRFTELYYVNTLFTYAYGIPFPKLSFLKKMKKGILEQFPNFRENPFYIEKTHPENKRLIEYQIKSDLYFLFYYKALLWYRNLRYGK